ncbi:LytR/AlgR family response regulator transcription factor [Flavobacterium capsici]|uniref:Response regulator transcription factor n=1 Tax=Flavobacterium capsici TaxID=3075618 RepID=A0AA96EVW2_9FLAO|nr:MULTISPECIES: response regulator transcription factor [unclassified Flavobacterium]WNM18877.1 response regulator transcription factor [Flavobacterium sp. PMR2A8]WNM22927.1 response regulator transcription factor [Flavobacterium sp. PMTSA4]
MNCIIIDDEMMARSIISQMITTRTQITILNEFDNPIEAIKFLNKNEVDVIFLDIHMPGFTGFDFIDTLKIKPKIILFTNDQKYAINAFEYDCIIDYLVKPLVVERFDKAMQKLYWRSDAEFPRYVPEDSSNEFYVNISNRLIKIDIPKILLIKAKGDYITIKTETNIYTVHTTLKKIEDRLPLNLFLKVHRSYIINIKKIIDIEDGSILIGKDVIPISRANKPELMKRLNLIK